MSTRSNIIIKKKDKTIESIYCHFDGYLSNNGKILLDNYTDISKINELINLGDISSLAEEVSPSLNNKNKNVVVAYKRDRGEENTDKSVWQDIKEYLENTDTLFIEYIYMYDEELKKWFYSKSDKVFKELTQEEIMKERF